MTTGIAIMARVHARKSYLLNKEGFSALLDQGWPSAAEWISKQKGFDEPVEQNDSFLNWGLKQLVDEVSHFGIWSAGDFLENLRWFLRFRELHNMKIAVRSIELGIPISKESLIELDPFWRWVSSEEISEVSSTSTLSFLYRKYPIYEYLDRALYNYNNHKNLGFFETEIDSSFMRAWLSSLKDKTLREILNYYLAWRNLDTLARCREIYHLDWVDTATFLISAEAPIDMKGLSRLYEMSFSMWGSILPRTFTAGLNLNAIQDLQHDFYIPMKRQFFKFCKGRISQSSFSPFGSIAYLFLKEQEIENIVLCLNGLKLGFSKEDIERELIIV